MEASVVMNETVKDNIERPYKALPPLSELKIATISHLHTMSESETARPGMYVFVPEYFPTRCKVISATAGHYARRKQSLTAEHFLVFPARTVAEAERLYEEARARGALADFIICIRESFAPRDFAYTEDMPRAPRYDNMRGEPEFEITCVCGRMTVIGFSDSAGSYTGPDDWKKRGQDTPDIHLPLGFYCGRDGHFLLKYRKR